MTDTIRTHDIPDQVLRVRLSGKLTEEDVEAIGKRIEAKLARYEKIGILADATGFEGMTAGAVLKDLQIQLGLLGDWHRFPKTALLVEEGALETFAEAAAAMMPQIELRTYAPFAADEALAFVSEVPPVERSA